MTMYSIYYSWDYPIYRRTERWLTRNCMSMSTNTVTTTIAAAGMSITTMTIAAADMITGRVLSAAR